MLRRENRTNHVYQVIRDKLKAGDLNFSNYEDVLGLLYFKERLFVAEDSELILLIMKEFHASKLSGHSGCERTEKRIRGVFYWKCIRKIIKKIVEECIVCQRMKILKMKPQGLFIPLPIPKAVWQDISMDFITRLPKVKGKSVLMVVVDQLSKFCHLMALSPDYTVTSVAQAFIQSIVKLHGIPQLINSIGSR